MSQHRGKRAAQGQSMIEYMILMAAVASIILIGFKTLLPKIHISSNIYFNRTLYGIYGNESRCGDGVCDRFEACRARCPIDCSGDKCEVK